MVTRMVTVSITMALMISLPYVSADTLPFSRFDASMRSTNVLICATLPPMKMGKASRIASFTASPI